MEEDWQRWRPWRSCSGRPWSWPGDHSPPNKRRNNKNRPRPGSKTRFNSLAATVKAVQARRDQLNILAAKDTFPVAPPALQLPLSQDGRGAAPSALRTATPGRGGRGPETPVPEAAGPRPGTFDVANTSDLKKAFVKAIDAYAVLLPLLDEQKKSLDDQLQQASRHHAEPCRNAGWRDRRRRPRPHG